MLICSTRFLVRVAFDPIAVGAQELVLTWFTSTSGELQVVQDAIKVTKPNAMTGSQLQATAAAPVVNLQGANVCAPSRAVVVMPTTVGFVATITERRHDLSAQVPLSYSALTLSHVYNIHSRASRVNS
jgi:hypothetical protein